MWMEIVTCGSGNYISSHQKQERVQENYFTKSI